MNQEVEIVEGRFVRKVDTVLQLFFPYDEGLVKNIKRKNLSKPYGQKWIWNPKAKCWECPSTKVNLRRLKGYGFDLEGVDYKEEVQKPTWQESDVLVPDVVGANGGVAWDFQKDVLKFLNWRYLNDNGSGLLALDMALGKSVIACLWAKHLKEEYNKGRTLIICPANLKAQWKDYHKEWIDTDVEILETQSGMELDESKDYIINYDVLTAREYVEVTKKKRDGTKSKETIHKIKENAWFKFLVKNEFDLVIVDESQMCNNKDSMRGKALIDICRSTHSCMFLSGTPIKTKPSQYWLCLNMIDRGLFPSLAGFKKMYSIQRDTGYGLSEMAGCKNYSNLYSKLADIMVRYKKEDVLKDLPDKNRVIIPINLDNKVYSSGLEEFNSSLNTIGIDATKKLELGHALDSLSRSVFDAKKEFICNWLDEWLEINPTKKIMIFGWHRVVIEFLHEYYKKISVPYYGGITSKQKIIAKAKFIEDPTCRLFIANAQSGGTGLDGFQVVCDTCAFVEMTQSPADSDQAEDRLLRPKQKNSVTCYYLPAEDSIDMDIIEIWDAKREMIDKLVEGKEVSDSKDLLMRLYSKYSKKKGLLDR